MTTQKITSSITKNTAKLKKELPAEDILVYPFQTVDGVHCAIVYADGIINKELLGELVAKPISALSLQNEGGRVEMIAQTIRFPELKQVQKIQDCVKEILDGNSAVLVDGVDVAFIVGAKFLPVRAIMEPPTDVAIKGPREGFVEDVKTNMALVRKRLKTPDLRFETMKVGKRSDTAVTVCWLEGTSNAQVKAEICQKIQAIDVDVFCCCQ